MDLVGREVTGRAWGVNRKLKMENKRTSLAPRAFLSECKSAGSPAVAIQTTPKGRRKQCVISFLLLRFLFFLRNKEKKMKNF